MSTTPIGLSFVTFVLTISVFAAGYLFGMETAAANALSRINYIFFRMHPKPPDEGADVDVQMYRLMKRNLPRIEYGGKFSISLVLISLAIIAFVMYTVSEGYGAFLAVTALVIFLVGDFLGKAVWKGKAKVAFVHEFNGLSRDLTSINDLPIYSLELLFVLLYVQAEVCGTGDEIPFRRPIE